MGPKGGQVLGELTEGARHDRLPLSLLKRKLLDQKFVVGTFLGIPSPAIVELLGLGGFDFVVIDGEHSAIDLKETEDLIRAGHSTQISVLVRVAKCDSHLITQPLDMGAAGVQVPQIESPEMARMAVNAAKYHPLGSRGLQPYVRSASYRAYGTDEYLAHANEESLLVAQIEGKKGIDNLGSILKVEGLDIAFFGPYDLSQSLGIPGEVRNPRVLEMVKSAIEIARNSGKYVGIYCDDAETAIEYRSIGVSYLTIGIDAGMFLTAARSLVRTLKS